MANTRRVFSLGKMDKDTDDRLILDGAFRHAENINVVNSEGSNVGTVQNSYSNKKLTDFNFGSNAKCVLGYADETRDMLYWFIVSSTGCYLMEWDNQNEVLTPVLQDTRAVGSRVLDLNPDKLITGIGKIINDNIEDDLLLWTDDNMQPCCINIERAKSYAVNGFVEEDIFLIKKPPRYAPTTTPTYSNEPSNNIEEKFLTFSYRYKFPDGEYSALSSYTNYQFFPKPFNLDYQTLENLGMVNAFNAVRIGFDTGESQVVGIEVFVKASNSNNLYRIGDFDKEKEGWGDSQIKTVTFSNNKLYSVLPTKELYRAFDNVPRKAKALTLINNRPVFGNYIEGYDIKDENGNKIKLNYEVSYDTITTEGTDLEIDMPDNTIVITFPSNLPLKKDYRIEFDITMESALYDGTYTGVSEFILPKDFVDAIELSQDADFIYFVDYVLKGTFLQGFSIDLPDGYEQDTIDTFEIIDATATTITIQGISINYIVDNTPLDAGDSDFGAETVDFNFISPTNIIYFPTDSVSSCKTNRDYEVGIVYLDKYNRATTVLTTFNNTVYIPQEYSINKNSLLVDINHKAPYWADRYKLVVKVLPANYQTLYVSQFYEDEVYRWVKLEGENKDKVKEGDVLILKRSKFEYVKDVIKTKVLEIKEQPTNFLATNVAADGSVIVERPGRYMKIKPNGFQMDYGVSEFHSATSAIPGAATRDRPFNYVPLFTTEDPPGNYTDLPIKIGSVITIILDSYRSGRPNGRYAAEFIVQEDYPSFFEWAVENFIGIPKVAAGGDIYNNVNVTRGIVIPASPSNFYATFVPQDPGNLYLFVEGLYPGNGTNRNGYLQSYVSIRTVDGVFIFETEPKQAENVTFYETEQTFDIVDYEHQGNLANQDLTAATPAKIKLDFFNCYAQGNGAESYQVKDSALKDYLNIDLRPSATAMEEYREVRRFADLTYGEIYNESSNINGLNEFNISTGNFKLLDKDYGSIQKLHSRDNDILILQEEKASKVLFERNALFNADGSTNVSAMSNVLGTQVTYLGENGIGKNPEGFAVNDYQIYYPNPNRGTYQRLSMDGTTEINDGMKDYFRDMFRDKPFGKKLGAYDPYFRQYVIFADEEPDRMYEANCGNTLYKANQTEPFTYTLYLNELTGDIVLNYDVTDGEVTISAVHDGTTTTQTGLTGTGNVTITRDNISADTVVITITPTVEPATYQISNVCPLGLAMKIVTLVVGDVGDLTKSIVNRFRWNSGNFYEENETFLTQPVVRFEEEIGIEGVGKFPASGSTVNIQSLKDAAATADFLTDECNKLGYLVSSTVYTEADYQDILDNATYVSITTTTQGVSTIINSGNFMFSRASVDDILYLVYDYTDKKPELVNDTGIVNLGESITIDVLNNDTVTGTPVVTITTDPIHGTAVVNVDNTITYTNDGDDFATDSLVYHVDNGLCTAEATLDITLVDVNAYCVEWTAINDGDIKMSLDGTIDFTSLLAGRTIHVASTGTVTGYIIDGTPVSCSIPLTFDSTSGTFSDDGLSVVTGEVLTQITIHADIIFNDASELTVDSVTSAMEFPDASTATYNDCV